MNSVSGNDILLESHSSVSMGDMGTTTELQYTLFDKPLEIYTVQEGLLLCIVLLLLVGLILGIGKESK